MFYLKPSVSNLYFRHPELNARRLDAHGQHSGTAGPAGNLPGDQEGRARTGHSLCVAASFHVRHDGRHDNECRAAGGDDSRMAAHPAAASVSGRLPIVARDRRPQNRSRPTTARSARFTWNNGRRRTAPRNSRSPTLTPRAASHFDLNPEKIRRPDLNDPALAPFVREGAARRFYGQNQESGPRDRRGRNQSHAPGEGLLRLDWRECQI